MKIVNNNIYITRGETDTYNVRLIDKTTGAPFVLPKTQADNDLKRFVITFSVRRSDYIKDGYAIKKLLDITSDKFTLLNDTQILPYGGMTGNEIWDNNTTVPNPVSRVLYKRKTALGTYDYRYWDDKQTDTETNTHWMPYSFEIRFPFLYSDTSELSPKAYKYSMTIYGGSNLQITEDKDIVKETIDYKKPLVDAQFIVEADINE